MNTNNFPLSFEAHLVFVAVAFIFFIIQFVRLRKKYQLIMAIAVAMTMLIYVKDTKMWFYGIGILEIGLLILALIAAIVGKPKNDELFDSDDDNENVQGQINTTESEEVVSDAEETEETEGEE